MKMVQGKPFAGFERGRVYVLEFWATWCGSCRPAMPHLSELATRFAGKPVEIYSVSDEAPAKIEPFLKAFPTKTQVVGGAGDLFESLGVRLLPTTVLIDREGRVAAFTKPEAVTEAVVDALLKGDRIDVPLAIEWTPGERASLVRALAGLGLDLTKETRRVPTLVVEPKEATVPTPS